MDISCQHLGNECWRVSVRPSGKRWENVHFWNMYQLNIYVGIEYIMPTLGDECKLGGCLVPFGHRVGRMYIFGICIS